jgi:hypothetical protein
MEEQAARESRYSLTRSKRLEPGNPAGYEMSADPDNKVASEISMFAPPISGLAAMHPYPVFLRGDNRFFATGQRFHW